MRTLLLTFILILGYNLNAQLVINEVNYDIAGQDTSEFIELKNDSSMTGLFTGYYLLLINGGTVPPKPYDSISLPTMVIAANDYYVICGDTANVKPCDFAASKKANLIQNGGSGTSGPDAIALFDKNKKMIDVISYEGSVKGYVETNGDSIKDDPNFDAVGLSRYPDGVDTDNNNKDFSLRCITPGKANTSQSKGCLLVTAIPELRNVPNTWVSSNPVNHTLTIDPKMNGEWTLYNIHGQAVKQGNAKTVNVSSLGCGMYFIHITVKGKSFSQKVMLF